MIYTIFDQETELDWLQTEGVITPVQFSPWAVPIVPIVKNDGNIRICGNYKLTVNQAARDKYPLPRIVCITGWRNQV